MRTLLLNDARGISHLGCDLVVENLLKQCQRVGLQMVATLPHGIPNDPQCVESRLSEFDVLLVNGEGTLHDDCDKGISLMRAVQIASSHGKPCFLVNTVWQRNATLNAFLHFFQGIYCRESFSTEEIQRAGHAAKTVPDLVFDFHPDVSHNETLPQGIAVLDSVDGQVSRAAAWYAVRHRLRFTPMHRVGYERIKKRWLLSRALRIRMGEPLPHPPEEFLSAIRKSEAVLSPRFHGVCLAWLLGKPVVAIASNTHKIEGMFRDADIPQDLIFPQYSAFRRRNGALSCSKWAQARNYQPQVHNYISEARCKIATMFDEISTISRQHLDRFSNPPKAVA